MTTANEILIQIGNEIRTQNNRCTSDPVFLVQQKRRIWGMDSDWCDDYVWIDNGGSGIEADEEKFAELDRLDYDGEEINGWVKTYYVDIWDHVITCFTEKACDDFMRTNAHRLNEPRSYVASGYRNYEWQSVRNHLMSKKIKINGYQAITQAFWNGMYLGTAIGFLIGVLVRYF